MSITRVCSELLRVIFLTRSLASQCVRNITNNSRIAAMAV